jgi:putative transposase
MLLNKYGQIAEKQWFWLGEQYPCVVLHSFIIMPDHIHGIIEINRARNNVGTNHDIGTILIF